MNKKKIISIITAIAITGSIMTGCGNAEARNTKITKAAKTVTETNVNNTSNTTTSTSTTGEVSSYFSQDNGNCDQQLVQVINSSKSTLDVAIYSLTKENIVDTIINAKKHGVNVRLITDRIESKSKSESKQLVRLKDTGIPIKVNVHKGLMHMKVSIIDKNIVTTGSYNYTQNATKENDEVFVVLRNSNAAQQYENEFERMWNDNTNFKEY